MRRAGLAVAAAIALGAGPARATWSIAAVDPETREVGVAGASCILGVQVIGGLAPGHGAVASQAWSNKSGRDRAVERLAAGATPDEIVGELASREFDSRLGLATYDWRQYGIASLAGSEATASFTGARTFAWAGARSGAYVSVQGNMLWGPEVVDRALEAFLAPGPTCAARLADRLLRALEAGAAAGGDMRCARELSALSAFIAVAQPDDRPGQPSLHLAEKRPGEPPTRFWRETWRMLRRPLPGTAAENPVTLLRARYDAWRAESGPTYTCE